MIPNATLLPYVCYACNAILSSFAVPCSYSGMEHSCVRGERDSVLGPNAESDLAGYRLHYGTSSRAYGTSIDAGMQTTFAVNELGLGTYYFSVTACNSSGAESPYSNEVAKVFQPASGTPDLNLPTIIITRAPLVTDSMATISWTTNKDSDSRILLGETADYGASLA
jgi:hypothetical protein